MLSGVGHVGAGVRLRLQEAILVPLSLARKQARGTGWESVPSFCVCAPLSCRLPPARWTCLLIMDVELARAGHLHTTTQPASSGGRALPDPWACREDRNNMPKLSSVFHSVGTARWSLSLSFVFKCLFILFRAGEGQREGDTESKEGSRV